MHTETGANLFWICTLDVVELNGLEIMIGFELGFGRAKA